MAPRCAVPLLACALGLAAAAPATAADVPPTAIAVTSDGTSYVGDGSTGVIRVYSRAGALVGQWGQPGQAAGQIGGVIALDVAGDGALYVLDVYNRVQVFGRDGTFVRSAELPVCTRGTPSAPGLGGLDAFGSVVWVASPCNDRVYRLSSGDLGVEAQFSVVAPRGLHAEGNRLYVARWNRLDVGIYDFGGTLRDTRPISGQPTDVFTDVYGVLHVADLTHDVVHMLGQDGVEFRTLGRPGSDPGDLDDVYQFDVVFQTGTSGAGDLLLADYGNARIQRWNSYGSTLFATQVDGGAVPPPPPPPPGARVGVTVNDAAAFTGSRDVTLTITPLPGATGVLIANDGGFGEAVERPLSGDRRYSWTLPSTGAERLPKTVYVRFTGGGVDGTKTFTDDIVLDLGLPSVLSASVSRGARAAAVRRTTVRVKARDALSGVGQLQFAARRGAARRAIVRYRRSVSVPAPQARFVRAVDRAGNAGKWRRVRR